jgi:hypothetical protein
VGFPPEPAREARRQCRLFCRVPPLSCSCVQPSQTQAPQTCRKAFVGWAASIGRRRTWEGLPSGTRGCGVRASMLLRGWPAFRLRRCSH